MPNSRNSPQAVHEGPSPSNGASLQERADALYRWAVETCHQHDRFARMMARTEDAAELRAAQELVFLCDETLCRMLQGYEKACKHAPKNDDEWWHRANALWHTCREYVRRHDGCDRASRSLELHTPDALARLQMQYELEASALLGLRQAADAYCKARPQRA